MGLCNKFLSNYNPPSFDLQQTRASSHILRVCCHYSCYLLRLESRSLNKLQLAGFIT